MKQKPRWTLEMLIAALAVLCALLTLALLVQRPAGWPALAVLVVLWGIGICVFRYQLRRCQIFLVRKAEGGGGKDDAVLQLQSTVINGAQDGVVHVTHSLFSSVLPFAAGSGAGAVPLRSARSNFVHRNRKIPGGRSGMLSHPPGSAPNDNCGPAFPGS